jgi:hypothetical protein
MWRLNFGEGVRWVQVCVGWWTTVYMLGHVIGGGRTPPTTFSTATIIYKRYEMLYLHRQDMGREPGETGAKDWDMNIFKRIIKQKITAITQ